LFLSPASYIVYRGDPVVGLSPENKGVFLCLIINTVQAAAPLRVAAPRKNPLMLSPTRKWAAAAARPSRWMISPAKRVDAVNLAISIPYEPLLFFYSGGLYYGETYYINGKHTGIIDVNMI
jgi:hypothetical protein